MTEQQTKNENQEREGAQRKVEICLFCILLYTSITRKPRTTSLVTWLLLLAAVEGIEADRGDLDDLEADSGKITDGVTGTAEAGDENLVVLLNEVEATVIGNEADDLLTVLDELDTDALANSGVRLLGLDTNLLEDDTLGVGRSTEGVGLGGGVGVRLLPSLVSPLALTAEGDELTSCVLTVDLGHGYLLDL